MSQVVSSKQDSDSQAAGMASEGDTSEPNPMQLSLEELATRFKISKKDAEQIRDKFISHDDDGSGTGLARIFSRTLMS